MQWLAMLTMLIDHIGVVFYPDDIWFRIIGRIAFPLYAYLMVLGYQRTRDYKRYVIRVAILALVSQPAYMLAFNTTDLNVIITLLIGLILLKVLDYFSSNKVLQIVIAVATLLIITPFELDYGAYAIILMLIYRYASKQSMLLFHALLEIGFLFIWGIQFISLIVTYMITMHEKLIELLEQSNVPRWLWRSFYPLHLFILAGLQYVF